MNVATFTGINQRMEAKVSGSGGVWVTGTIRVRNQMKNNDTGKYDSSFIDYKVLGGRASVFADYQQEGKELHITGHFMQENWESNGQKRSKLVLMVQDFDLPKREEQPEQPAFNSAPQGWGSGPDAGNGKIDLSDDDLPF